MAELTSGLTSVVFSPYSKMFIGGLSWQTSPGETVILFYTVTSISCCFFSFSPLCRCDWVLAVAAGGGVCANVHCAVVYCMGYLSSVCARCYFWSPSIWSPLFDPYAHRGVFLKYSDNSMSICYCQNDPTYFFSSSLYSQTALETILVNSEK